MKIPSVIYNRDSYIDRIKLVIRFKIDRNVSKT